MLYQLSKSLVSFPDWVTSVTGVGLEPTLLCVCAPAGPRRAGGGRVQGLLIRYDWMPDPRPTRQVPRYPCQHRQLKTPPSHGLRRRGRRPLRGPESFLGSAVDMLDNWLRPGCEEPPHFFMGQPLPTSPWLFGARVAHQGVTPDASTSPDRPTGG